MQQEISQMTLSHNPDLINIRAWLYDPASLCPPPPPASWDHVPDSRPSAPRSQLFSLETATGLKQAWTASLPSLCLDSSGSSEVHLFNIPLQAVDMGLFIGSLQPGIPLCPLSLTTHTLSLGRLSLPHSSAHPSQTVAERSLLMATL